MQQAFSSLDLSYLIFYLSSFLLCLYPEQASQEHQLCYQPQQHPHLWWIHLHHFQLTLHHPLHPLLHPLLLQGLVQGC